MRLALLSDIHGNSFALDAVMDDARRHGAEAWWVLGDMFALGPDPVGVADRLHALDDVAFIGGNTERYTLTGDLPYPQFDDVENDLSLLPRLVECVSSFAWTRGMLTNAGYVEWLGALPRALRTTLPDGTRVLGVHASPQRDDGPGISPDVDDTTLANLLAGCEADVIFGGHTHHAVDRVVDGMRAVNLGCVSNSPRADRAASYVLLDADEREHRVEHRVVDYDHGATLAAIHASSYPAKRYLIGYQQIN